MRNRALLIVLFLCLFVYASDDQIWLTGTISVPVSDNIIFQAIEQYRFIDEGDVFVQYLGFKKKCGDFSFAGWYKPVLKEIKSQSHWEKFHRGVGDITWGRKSEIVSFSDRNRIEYDFTVSKLIYRNRPKLDFGFIYVADEIFLDLSEENRINQNRFYVGRDFEINSSWKLGIYYMNLSKRKDSWHHSNVFGASASLKF